MSMILVVDAYMDFKGLSVFHASLEDPSLQPLSKSLHVPFQTSDRTYAISSSPYSGTQVLGCMVWGRPFRVECSIWVQQSNVSAISLYETVPPPNVTPPGCPSVAACSAAWPLAFNMLPARLSM